jgi:di/tricarboxylate transporter
MWNSFFRAIFIVGIVIGFQETCLGIYWLTKRNRLMALRWLLRGTSSLVVFSFLLWWLLERSLDPWDDTRFWLLILSLGPLTLGIEAYLRVHIEHKPARSMFEQRSDWNPTAWKKTRISGKARFIAAHVLLFSLAMVVPAIVFSVVSPELLAPYWWPLIILTLGLIGFAAGNRQWSVNEKRFNSQDNFG